MSSDLNLNEYPVSFGTLSDSQFCKLPQAGFDCHPESFLAKLNDSGQAAPMEPATTAVLSNSVPLKNSPAFKKLHTIPSAEALCIKTPAWHH